MKFYTLNPSPSAPTIFSAGTTTSSKVIPLVSEALCPMFISFFPLVIPGVFPSTAKAVKAFPGLAFGSLISR